jgi:transmembrane E3 ubiquitin-protein ligase
LPFLTSNNETFTSSKDLIAAYLEESMEKHASYRSTVNDDVGAPFRPMRCDMIVFLSVLPLSGVSSESLALYENEMRFPTGQTVVKPPAMELSGVMYSPDCGTALEWRDEPAVKVEIFWHAGRVIGIVAGMIAGVQVWWVLKEMGERGSPSVCPWKYGANSRA